MTNCTWKMEIRIILSEMFLLLLTPSSGNQRKKTLMYFIYRFHESTYQLRANISRVVKTKLLTLQIKPKTKVMMIISPTPPAPAATTTQSPPLPPIQQSTATNFSEQMR